MAEDTVTIRIQAEVDQAIRAVAELRKAFLDTHGQWTAASQEATKALNAFTGDQAIRRALNTAAAVREAGGAAVLTAKEMRQVNLTVGDAIAKYNALGQQVPAHLKSLYNSTVAVDAATSKWRASNDLLYRGFFRLTGAISLADLGVRAIIGSFRMIGDAIAGTIKGIIALGETGSKVQQIAGAFNRLQGAIGQIAGKTLDEARAKSKGLITDFDLMTAANRAMLFGLEVTPEKFGVLTEAAIKLGRAMGIDASKSMNDLVLALGRVSPRILDNLGIIVKVGEANAKWAEAHGKTIAQMTAGERVQAFYIEALGKIETHVKNLGEFTLTLADRMEILGVQWENFTNKLGVAISLSPVFNSLLDEMNRLFQQVFGASNEDAIQKIVWLIEDAVIGLVKFAEITAFIAQKVRQSWAIVSLAISGTLAVLNNSLSFTLDYFSKFLLIVGKINPIYHDLGVAIKAISEQTNKWAIENEKSIAANYRVIIGQDDFSKALNTTEKSLADLYIELNKVKHQKIDYTKVTASILPVNEKVIQSEQDVMDAVGRGKSEKEKLIKTTNDLVIALSNASKNGAGVGLVMKEYGAKITDVVNRSKIFGLEVPASILRWQQAIDKAIPSKDKLVEAANDLVEILSQVKEEMDISELAHAYGAKIVMMVDKFKLFGMAVPPVLKAWDDALTQYKATMKEIEDNQKNLDADLLLHSQRQEKMLTMRDEFEQKFLKIAQDGQEDRLALLDLEYKEAMAKLGPMIHGLETEWMEAASAIGKAHLAAGRKVTDVWKGTVGELAKALPNVLISALSGGGNAFASISAAIGKIIGPKLFNAEGGIGKKFSEMLVGAGGAAGTGGLASKSGPILGSILKGVVGMIPIIGPIIGMLAGPIAKGIKRLFTGPSMEKKVAADLGRDYGQAFSDGLVKKIAEDSKKVGDRMGGTLLHLSEIIKESGGVTVGTLDKWATKTRDIFVMLERGIFTTEQATTSLNEVFPQLSAVVQETGGIWNTKFRELINLSQKAGLNIKGIKEMMSGEQSKLASGTTGAVAGFTSQFEKLVKAADEAKAKLDGIGNTKSKEWEEASKLVNKTSAELKQAVVGAQVEFDRLGRITLASFNTLVASGKSTIEAVNELGAPIDNLIEASTKLGFTGNAAFEELKRWRTLVKENEPLLTQVSGLNDIMTATVNLGGMTEQIYKDLAAEGATAYGKLTQAGFTEQEALKQIAPFLENIIKLHEERGFAIDDETQKLIDAARKEGVLKEKQISTNDILMEGLGAIIKAVGGDLPEAWKKSAKAAEEAAADVTAATEDTKTSVEEVIDAVGTDIPGAWVEAGDAAIEAEREFQIFAEQSKIDIGKVIEAVGTKLPEAWEESAGAAEDASADTATAMQDAMRQISGVTGELKSNYRQWDIWADNAIDAAKDVQDAVDGVSFGSSPGGLKEWRPLLERSMKTMKDFSRAAVSDLRSVKDTMRDLPNMNPERMSSLTSGTASPTIAPLQGGNGIVWTGDMNISTWSLGEEIELIKKKLTPAVLSAIHSGGKNYGQFEHLVRNVRR